VSCKVAFLFLIICFDSTSGGVGVVRCGWKFSFFWEMIDGPIIPTLEVTKWSHLPTLLVFGKRSSLDPSKGLVKDLRTHHLGETSSLILCRSATQEFFSMSFHPTIVCIDINGALSLCFLLPSGNRFSFGLCCSILSITVHLFLGDKVPQNFF